MKRQEIILWLTGFIILCCASLVQAADSAEVLPKGISQLNVSSYFYFTIDERYDPDGNTEPLGIDYNVNLNSDIFPDLGSLETFFGMPPGSASLGKSDVDLELDITKVEIYYLYGLTDKISLGIKIPYIWSKVNVDSELDTSNTTIGLNPQHGQPDDPFKSQAPLIPIAGADVPLTKDNVIDLLSQNYGYEPFEDWNDDGIGDIEAGFRYQYLNNEKWRLAFTGVLQMPTGDIDDLDNLIDEPFGSGGYVLQFHFNNDFKATDRLLLDATFRYYLSFSYDEKRRIPLDVNQPITLNKERVDIDPGDGIELELTGFYQLIEGLSGSIAYEYTKSFKDDVSGKNDIDYSALEDETDWDSHVVKIGLTYSTVDRYMRKEAKLPLDVSIAYRNRFAGKNNVYKSEYIYLGMSVYF